LGGDTCRALQDALLSTLGTFIRCYVSSGVSVEAGLSLLPLLWERAGVRGVCYVLALILTFSQREKEYVCAFAQEGMRVLSKGSTGMDL